MRKKEFLKLVAILLIILTGCKNDDSIAQSKPDIFSVNLNKSKKNLNLSSIVDKNSLKIIPLETKEASLIGNIDKVIFTEDYIFVFDWFSSRSLFQFDKEGKFIRKIGTPGGGPGEYSMIYDFNIINNKIILLDMGYKLISYSLNGDYVSQTELKDFMGSKFIAITDNLLAFDTVGSEPFELTISTDRGEIIERHFPKLSIRKPLGLNTLFKTNNNTYFTSTYNDTVYNISKNGKIRPGIIIDYGEKKFNVNQYLNIANADDKIKNNLYKYCSTISLYENELYRHLSFSYNNELWIALQNKNNKKSIVVKKSNLKNDITFNEDNYVVGVANNKFITLLQPQELLLYIENAIDTPNTFYYNKIKETATKIKEEDNPILVLYTFKNL